MRANPVCCQCGLRLPALQRDSLERGSPNEAGNRRRANASKHHNSITYTSLSSSLFSWFQRVRDRVWSLLLTAPQVGLTGPHPLFMVFFPKALMGCFGLCRGVRCTQQPFRQAHHNNQRMPLASSLALQRGVQRASDIYIVAILRTLHAYLSGCTLYVAYAVDDTRPSRTPY